MIRFSHLRRTLAALLVGATLTLPALALSPTLAPQVAGATSATQTRFTNLSSYPIVSLSVDNLQRLPAGQVIPSNGSLSLTLSVGTHSYRAINGVGSTQMYVFQGTVSQQSGITAQVSFKDPTIYQLLSHGAATGLWQGSYFDNNGGFHLAAFRFTSGGAWTLYNDGVRIGTGTYALVSSNFAAFQVTFTVGGYNGILSITGGYFMMSNGPASFHTIQYVYQGL